MAGHLVVMGMADLVSAAHERHKRTPVEVPVALS